MSGPAEERDLDTNLATRGLSSHIFAILRFHDGTGRNVDKNLLHESTLIGSAKGADLRLKSESIAPVHCLITLNRWRLAVRDLSGGQTKLNGHPVQTAHLSDGDKLTLGVHEFEIRTNLSGAEFHGFYLDHYEVTEVLGSGGMCWLYGGRNTLTHEPVALKVLPSNFTPRTLAHFSLEARVGQKLGSHPHVIRISRIVRADPVYCIVMEYLEGVSLQELVDRDGPLGWALACHFIRQAALGLAHVHRLNIVHRDVKPNNFIVCREGGLKLIDFNLALMLGDQSADRLLQHYRKYVVGTADYISPEQSQRSDEIDARSDLYALGCVFFFLLTGKVLYPVPGVTEKLQAQRTQPPPDLKALVPALPDALVAVVLKLLEKDPEQRYQTADEVAGVLEVWSTPQAVRFDWSAVLSARAATAKRRLEKLLAKQSARRREAAQDSSATVIDSQVDTLQGSGVLLKPTHDARPIELDLFTTLDEGSPQSIAEQNELSEIFHMWPQLKPEARTELVNLARCLEHPGDGKSPTAAGGT